MIKKMNLRATGIDALDKRTVVGVKDILKDVEIQRWVCRSVLGEYYDDATGPTMMPPDVKAHQSLQRMCQNEPVAQKQGILC